jgi:hypothetical protein
MEIEYISIPIPEYKRISSVKDDYDGAHYFDKKCGIYFEGGDDVEKYSFRFKVVDKEKWFLAKIKYGI